MKRPGDTTPPPPGGRAAARLRLFEQPRHLADAPPASKPRARKKARKQTARTKNKR